MSARTRLENRRACETFAVEFQAPGTGSISTFALSVGPDPSDPAEVFVQGTGNTKPGALMADILRDTSVVISIALQYGTPIEALADAVTREDSGAPSSPIGAVLDAMARG
jgi:hypothetical protein